MTDLAYTLDYRKQNTLTSYIHEGENPTGENLGEIGINAAGVELDLDSIKKILKSDSDKNSYVSSKGSFTYHGFKKFDIVFRVHESNAVEWNVGVRGSLSGLSKFGTKSSYDMSKHISVVGIAMYDIIMERRVKDNKKKLAVYIKGLTQVFNNSQHTIIEGDDLIAVPMYPEEECLKHNIKYGGYYKPMDTHKPLIVTSIRSYRRERFKRFDYTKLADLSKTLGIISLDGTSKYGLDEIEDRFNIIMTLETSEEKLHGYTMLILALTKHKSKGTDSYDDLLERIKMAKEHLEVFIGREFDHIRVGKAQNTRESGEYVDIIISGFNR